MPDMEQSTQTQDLKIGKAIQHLKAVLVSGETLDAWAVQLRLFALTHRRMLIAATTGRFIVIKRNLFGGFDMNDFRWQDLGDVKLKVGIFGADIYVKKFGSTDLAMNKNASYYLSLKVSRKTRLKISIDSRRRKIRHGEKKGEFGN
jgi:hypothetical protein